MRKKLWLIAVLAMICTAMFAVGVSAAETETAVESPYAFAKLTYTDNGASFKLLYSADYKNTLTTEGISGAVSAYTWTGVQPADIADGAYILYTADTDAKTLHVQEVLGERGNADDDTYKLSTYIRPFGTIGNVVNYTAVCDKDGNVYRLGHDVLPDSPIRTSDFGGTGKNTVNNVNTLQQKFNTYCDLYIVDNCVVYMETNPGLDEYIVIDSIVRPEENGIVVSAYSTLTDSFGKILLKEFNGWSLGGFEEEWNNYLVGNLGYQLLPINEHSVCRVMYKDDDGYCITDTMPLAESHTIAANEYGYIEGTDGVSLAANLYIPATDEDTWAIVDRRVQNQEKTYLYHGKMPEAEFRNVRVYKVSDHKYILEAGTDTVIPSIAWQNKPITPWNGTAASAFASGTGTETDPYVIATPEQLAYLAQSVNAGESYAGKYFVQVADIVLNDTSAENWTTSAKPWIPIGTYTSDTENAPFSGSFDGNGYTIRGLYIYALKGTTVWYGYQGLFGDTHNAELKNIHIDTTEITAASYAGALAGYTTFDANTTAAYTISGCSVKNARIIGETNIGGLVGRVYSYASGGTNQNRTTLSVSLTDCTAENCTVLGEEYVGGVVGALNGAVSNSGYNTCAYTLSGCQNLGGSVSVTGGQYAGGVVGYCYANGSYSAITFTGCTNSGDVSASSSSSSTYAGGIVGYCYARDSYSAITFTGCTNSGDVSASSSSFVFAGGIVGHCYAYSSYSAITFTDCTNSGAVSASSSDYLYAGGIVGNCDFATFTDCTNSGDVSASSFDYLYAGGIAGYCSYSATFTDCTNSGDVSASSYRPTYAGGIAGYCSSSATFTDCTNSGDITSDDYAGGIVGYSYADGSNSAITFTDCTNSGDITSDDYAGGISVYANTVIRCSNTGKVSGCGIVYQLRANGKIEYCYNTGEVGESGIVGTVGESCSVEYCYNTGSNPVPTSEYTSTTKRGGIVGSLTSSTVRNCFNTGTFYGNQYVGGIVGYAYGGQLKLEAYILQCYNIGCVNGMAYKSGSTLTPASYIGSVAGWANPFTQVTGCYYTANTAISDSGVVQGGVGAADCSTPFADTAGSKELRSHAQMQTQANFAGYDFTSVWTMGGNSTYPYPELIKPAMEDAAETPAPLLLTEIVTPNSVTGIPHGMKWEESNSSYTDILDSLPKTVVLKLSDGSTREASVVWTCEDYVQYPADKMKPYSYAAIGTVTLPAGIANPQNIPLTTGIAFTVDAFVLSVKSVSSSSKTVLNGTSFADMVLPQTVWVRFNDDSEQQLPVTWMAPDVSAYDPSLETAQRFTVYGTVTLPEGVQDPLALAGTASVSVSVQEKKYYTLNSINYTKTGTYDNGTFITDFDLPASITIYCPSYGSIDMKVTWDTASCGYDPASKEKQVLAIKGTINLPDYILDPNGLADKIVFTATVKAMPYVTGVNTANSVYDVLNGTPLKDIVLPETVYISLSTGYSKEASVEWDLDRSYSYDPQKQVSQSFYVYGTVILPDRVYNINNIPLDTSCYVYVDAVADVYLSSVTQPSPNKITVDNGIDLNTVEMPKTTRIRLNTDVYKEVSIVWDLAGCGYDPTKTGSQTLTVKGQIQLPENIPNIANVSTEVKITVVVQSLTASVPYVRTSISTSHTKYNIQNGTALTADLLPSEWTVYLTDVTGKYPSTARFPISWDLEGTAYDPTNPHMQHVSVSGRVQLPDDVANPNNYSMNVTAHLWFDASTESGTNVVALAKPTEVTFENGVVSWTASENAQGYEVTLYKVADGLEVILTVNADGTQYDFASVIGMDTYMATVIALGDGIHYADSTASYSKFYTAVPLISAVPPAITAQPVSASYVVGSKAAPLTVTAFSPEGVVSYRWYESPDGTTAMGMPLENPSEDPSKFIPDTSAAGTRYYYVVVTCTNDAATGEKTADTVSEVASVTVTNGTGYSISGTVSSFGEGDVTIQLVQNGKVCYETTASSDGTYSITGIAAGEYTLRVSKPKHVTREYVVVIGKNM